MLFVILLNSCLNYYVEMFVYSAKGFGHDLNLVPFYGSEAKNFGNQVKW